MLKTKMRGLERFLEMKGFRPQLKKRIELVRNEYALLDQFVQGLISGTHKAGMIQGGPGTGKTEGVNQALQNAGLIPGVSYLRMSSFATPLALFLQLYKTKDKGKILVIDDCDSLFQDESCLNILKSATDPRTSQVSWATSRMKDLHIVENGRETLVPPVFKFEGSVVIITNVSFDHLRKGRVQDHYNAIKDRCVLFPIEAEEKDTQLARAIFMIAERGMLQLDPRTAEITPSQQQMLIGFVVKNVNWMRGNLSLRLVNTIAREIVLKPRNWRSMAERHMRHA